jgi:hypothetical protein
LHPKVFDYFQHQAFTQNLSTDKLQLTVAKLNESNVSIQDLRSSIIAPTTIKEDITLDVIINPNNVTFVHLTSKNL